MTTLACAGEQKVCGISHLFGMLLSEGKSSTDRYTQLPTVRSCVKKDEKPTQAGGTCRNDVCVCRRGTVGMTTLACAGEARTLMVGASGACRPKTSDFSVWKSSPISFQQVYTVGSVSVRTKWPSAGGYRLRW